MKGGRILKGIAVERCLHRSAVVNLDYSRMAYCEWSNARQKTPSRIASVNVPHWVHLPRRPLRGRVLADIFLILATAIRE